MIDMLIRLVILNECEESVRDNFHCPVIPRSNVVATWESHFCRRVILSVAKNLVGNDKTARSIISGVSGKSVRDDFHCPVIPRSNAVATWESHFCRCVILNVAKNLVGDDMHD